MVKDQQRQAYARSLFHDHFHSAKKAARMENVTWFAKWTHQPDDGNEEVFEVDSLICWSTDGRLRMVGDGTKGAVYPMEGVVSADGHIALSYWSEGNIPICGVVLMEQADLKGDVLEGTWSGYTARSLEQRQLTYFRGRVVMAKDRKVATERWGLLPPAPQATSGSG